MAERTPGRPVWRWFIAGGGLVSLGLAGLVLYLVGFFTHVGFLIMSFGDLVPGVTFLASGVARYRRARSRGASHTSIPPGFPLSSR